MNNGSNINTRILVNGIVRKLTPQVEVNIFRVVQEALNNIKRHSKANEAVVTLEFNTQHLKIAIKDDGRGFRSPRRFHRFALRGKLGLAGMQQRIQSLDGTFQIRSRPGEGTLLLIEIEC